MAIPPAKKARILDDLFEAAVNIGGLANGSHALWKLYEQAERVLRDY